MSLGVPEEEQLWMEAVPEGQYSGGGSRNMPSSPAQGTAGDHPPPTPGRQPAGRALPAAGAPRLRQLSPHRTGSFRPSAAAIPEGVAVVEHSPYSAVLAGGRAGGGAAAGAEAAAASPARPAGQIIAGGGETVAEEAAPSPQPAADSPLSGGEAAAAAVEARESTEVGDEEEEQLPGNDLPPPPDEKRD